MKQYFYAEGEEQKGPHNIEELKSLKISKDTKVWTEGMDDWEEAGTIDELSSLFEVTPPPIKKVENQPPPVTKSEQSITPNQAKSNNIEEPKETEKVVNNVTHIHQPKKKSYVGWIMIGLMLISATILGVTFKDQIFGSGSSGSGSSDYFSSPGSGTSNESYQDASESLEDMEKSDPASFLDATGQYWPTLIGKNFKIDGEIISSAAKTTYRNPVIRVRYYNERGSQITTVDYKIYDKVRPGSTINFDLKIPDEGAKTIGWDVVSAEYD